MLKLIQTTADLPPVGSSHEMARMEFKLEASDRGELAKDVGAFANCVGGTILVGAARDGDRLATYRPMAKDVPAAAMRGYDEAIRDLCLPKPLVEVHEIAVGGGHVLAVNVWPFPGQPVGVLVSERSYGAYRFPFRSGSQTTYLTPDQLPMMMIPEVRRVAVLLSQIPENDRKALTLIMRAPPHQLPLLTIDERRARLNWKFEDAVFRNTVSLTLIELSERYENARDTEELVIPADAIKHVWRNAHGGGWCIAANVWIQRSFGGEIVVPLI